MTMTFEETIRSRHSTRGFLNTPLTEAQIGNVLDNAQYAGVFGERQKHQGKTYYEALGIARTDKEGRAKSFRRNLTFFNAPLCGFPIYALER